MRIWNEVAKQWIERSASVINSYSLREKKKKGEETLSVLRPTRSPRLLSDLLRAECIRNVTWDGGMAGRGREGNMVAG